MLKLRQRGPIAAMLLPAVLALGACSNGFAGSLRASGIAGKPDEFMVLPTRPLEIPQDLSTLPVPQPGTANRVDYQPETIAVAGLTGQEGRVRTASGAPLLARAGAASRDPQIRARLAQEDLEYRRSNNGRLLERIFSRNKEALVYEDMTLDAGSAYEQMRARGLVDTAPPPNLLAE
jgi:hypothetical protein